MDAALETTLHSKKTTSSQLSRLPLPSMLGTCHVPVSSRFTGGTFFLRSAGVFPSLLKFAHSPLKMTYQKRGNGRDERGL